ncbi:SMI1/KNR4 family protein [Streptomyces sp. SL13]|uniref:SMI1/KNR4 family protein n=1 Tax=Streptantibioticus silvisoli TaxID=2705255 RepID=A0AA90KA04_9ACTN|nr:SMI1/KNR4 family protein [Streptantibioticus silvisoli]MDI5971818.1 SMI1/KNR4 family protein [Streptantibioticus silvisoli]
MNEFDFVTGLAAALRDRAAAWAFVRAVAAFWNVPLVDGDGVGEAELTAAERRLGLPLPAALREAYALLGRRSDLTSNQDTLLPPDELTVFDGVLVFRRENQGVAHWGIPVPHPDQEDPPVVVRLDLADKAQERWEPWLGSVSAAFTGIVLAEPLLAADESCDFCYRQDDHARAVPAADFTGLEFPGGPGSRWFAAPDVLVADLDGTGLAARARTPEALDALREHLGGDWLAG